MFQASRLGLQVVVLRVSGGSGPGMLGLVQGGEGEAAAGCVRRRRSSDLQAVEDALQWTLVRLTRELRWSLVYEYEIY